MTLKRKKSLIVKKSKINNLGLFCTSGIPADTLIIEYIGEKITDEETEIRDTENDKTGITYTFYLNKHWYIDGAIGGDESRYANHSCNPNCKVVRKNGGIFFYSKRQVAAGEELTIDYAYDKDSDKEICRCQDKNCRGFINVS